MKKLFEELLNEIGENPEREGLKKTPERAERAWEFLTKGYHQKLEDIINNAVFKNNTRDMIIVKDIEIYSLCEHHLLPFFGRCHIGYIPNGSVLGVSKLARITDFFSRRLQIQEELTHQIAETVMKILQPEGVGVIIEAKHLCMMMRGVEKQNSKMITSSMQGNFRSSSATREEFLRLSR